MSEMPRYICPHWFEKIHMMNFYTLCGERTCKLVIGCKRKCGLATKSNMAAVRSSLVCVYCDTVTGSGSRNRACWCAYSPASHTHAYTPLPNMSSPPSLAGPTTSPIATSDAMAAAIKTGSAAILNYSIRCYELINADQ